MEIPRPSDDDKAVFNALVPDRPDVVVKPMFGNLGAYVNGNMFMGLFGASIGIKLSRRIGTHCCRSTALVPSGRPSVPWGAMSHCLPPGAKPPRRRTAG